MPIPIPSQSYPNHIPISSQSQSHPNPIPIPSLSHLRSTVRGFGYDYDYGYGYVKSVDSMANFNSVRCGNGLDKVTSANSAVIRRRGCAAGMEIAMLALLALSMLLTLSALRTLLTLSMLSTLLT